MPTYGYECLSCDNQFEIFQSIKDDALTTCETCGGKLRKRIYPVGISFKGSGFYVNDYAPKPSGGGESSAPASTPSAEAAAPAASGEAKPEAKTEAKPEAKSEPAKTETKAEAKAPTPAAS